MIHSTWAMPAAADAALFEEIVADLAPRFGFPRFAPHLTLLEDREAEAATLAAFWRNARPAAAIDTRIAGIETGPAYFRSVFARIDDHPALLHLHERGRDRFPGGSDFRPHVSLAYGVPDETARKAVAADLSARLAGRPIRFDRICVVASGQEIAIEDWKVLADIPLG